MSSEDIKNRLRGIQGNMMSYAYMLTANRETARMLIEHTTDVVFKQSADLSNDSMFKGWIFSIMRKVFATEFQNRQRARTSATDIFSINLTAAELTSHSRPEGTVGSASVTRAIESLTDGYRKVIVLFFSGHSLAEISSEMSLPVQVVKSRIAYCRNRLRMQLSC